VERLLSQGAHINENVLVEGTALHIASYLGHIDVVRLLLEKGADVDTKVNRFGSTPNHVGGYYSGTPLHDVVTSHTSFEEIAQLLLDYGADINSKEGLFHLTPLHLAVDEGTMVEFLISKGADVNAVADREPPPDTFLGSYMICPDVGMTPLHVAARKGDTHIARQLVAAGAAVDIKVARTYKAYRHYQGLTALEVAQLAREQQQQVEAQLTALAYYDELVQFLAAPSIA
jgi:ankyrin repeat protein